MPRDLTRTKTTDEQGGGLDEFATSRRRVVKDTDEAPVVAGWSANRNVSVKRGDSPDRFGVPDNGEEVIIAFLEDQPFASFFQHWIKVEGKQRPFTCLVTNCPLCDRGHRPKPQDWFNVVQLTDPDEKEQAKLPALRLWYASADPAEAVKEVADKERYSPINKPGQYCAVSKVPGKNNFPHYTVMVVKEAELEDDFGVEPLTAEQVAAFKEHAYTAALVKTNTRTELLDIAEDYLSD